MRPVTLPFGETASQIVLEAGGGLVALLGRLGEELHDDLGDHRRDALQPFRRCHRLSRDMAMDPFHRIGGAERQTAGEHLVERHAERVEIATRIDRAVHPPGLFGRHIGERAGDDFGRLGRLTLARQTRGDAEPGEPGQSVRAVHQDIGRLDVLVDEAALVRLAQRGDDADGEAQEAARLHRRADEPIERLAARILEQQRGSTAFAASASGRAAHAASSSSLSSYSWARRSRTAGGGRSTAGSTARKVPRPPSLSSRHPRRKTRSPSSHTTWRPYSP